MQIPPLRPAARRLVRCLAVVSLAVVPLALPLFSQDGGRQPAATQWWKGNLHTHSLWSDGNDFPENIAAWYKEHGWHFLALSDHNTLSAGERWMKVDDVVRRGGRAALARYRERFGAEWVETRDADDGKTEVRLRPLSEFRGLVEAPGEFLMIQAEEISDGFAGRPIHINASNLEDVLKPQGGTSVRRVMDRNLQEMRAQAEALGRPIVPHLNHPNFGWAVTAEDLAAVVEDRFFEVYNGHPSVHHLGDETRPSVERLWDIACALRIDRYGAPPPFGVATDDSHHYFTEGIQRSNSGRGWVWVRSPELDGDRLMSAMLAGDFYASSGVALRDVTFAQGVLALAIDAEDGVEYQTVFYGTREDYDRTADAVEGGGTWRYSDDVGAVLATVSGAAPSYALTGDELYVRAVVTSTRAPTNPSFEGQMEQAWTQPVGWRHRVGTQVVRFGAVQCEGVWDGPLTALAVDPRGSIYWGFENAVVRTDCGGRVLAQQSVPGVADLCVRGGQVFAAIQGHAVWALDGSTLALDSIHADPAEAPVGGLTWVGARFAQASVVGGALSLRTFTEDWASVDTGALPDAKGAAVQCMEFAEGRWWIGLSEPARLCVWPVGAAGVDGVQWTDFDATQGLAVLGSGRFMVGASVPRGSGWVGRANIAVPGPDGGLVLVK